MSESTIPTGREARCDYCRRPKADVGLSCGAAARTPSPSAGAASRWPPRRSTPRTAAGLEAGAAGDHPVAQGDRRAHLDRSVVGQGRAKRTLAIAVSNHFIRLLDAMDRGAADPIVADAALRDVTIEKCNVLLIGPSGCGQDAPGRRPWPST